MCFINCADETGEIEAVVFPDLFSISSSRLNNDNVLIVNGKISVKDESVTIICGSIFEENEFEKMTEQMSLCIKTDSASLASSEKLTEIYREFSGYTELCFYLTDRKKFVSPKTKFSFKVCRSLYLKLQSLYSPEKIGLIKHRTQSN